ncbi:MAG: hypothetical protein E7Z80_02420 [Methanobrevibacter thaueri]|nr:hypothetical protein [Methanobrevibacter thaueri]
MCGIFPILFFLFLHCSLFFIFACFLSCYFFLFCIFLFYSIKTNRFKLFYILILFLSIKSITNFN